VVEVAGDEANGWRMTLVNNNIGAVESLDTDVIVWATGFRSGSMDFLEPIAGRLAREGEEFRIDQDFAIQWDGPSNRCLFMQNGARQQRGLADPNLSLVAWRSQRIIDRMRGVRTENQLASFIDWSSNTAGSLRHA
jgi:lysine N6-hydroxylase